MVHWAQRTDALQNNELPLAGQKNKEMKQNKMFLVALFTVYLISQLFGLLAVVTQFEKIFIPYVIVLLLVTITNSIVLIQSIYVVVTESLFPVTISETVPPKSLFNGVDASIVLTISLIYLIYNVQCICSVLHICSRFDMKKLLAAQRHREMMAHNRRIYARLVAINSQDQQIVTVNVDSPPKYSVTGSIPRSSVP
uniref:Uncharacterized protein n=1 Tax=Caenorhabditis japonica TaxID=281687 RepID=A0A8R1IL09_CAEJA